MAKPDQLRPEDAGQTQGRKENAATPLLRETDTSVTPEAYPATDRDDSIRPAATPLRRQGAGDGGPDAEG